MCSEAIEIIPSQAFYNTNITSVTVGKEVTFIGQQITTKATLTNLTFEDGGTSPLILGKQMLSSFGGTEIITPDRCTVVAYDALHSSSTLKKFVFGKNVTDIGMKIECADGTYTNEGRVFLSCTALETIVFRSKTPPTFHCDADNLYQGSEVNAHIFRSCTKIANGTAKIYVPSESVDLYKAADGFSEYASMIEANPEE